MTKQLQALEINGIANQAGLTTMIVFCHLRWDFVYQRPQHLLSRMAQHYKILIVEEPIFHEGEAFLKSRSVAPNITIYQPHTPIHAGGFHDDQIPVLQALLADLVPADVDPVAWLYTPMALPLLQTVHPSVVVYDCMDELSAFRNAPKQLLQRETALLGLADVVFTGGPSLYEAKRERHSNAHCFPSSVDVEHFAQALDRSKSHPKQAHIAGPRLGFYGVIDERFDIDLLRAMADAHPEWQLVMVGPVVKIDPESLPKNANIHYMGQASYEELPQYLAGWDVCLLPFALNESTKFISPTKVLEYMAAELPSVSTNITDVTKPYSNIVSIGYTHEEFIAHCEDALAMSPQRRAQMLAGMRAVVQNTSWNKTANQMRQLMKAGDAGKRKASLAEAAGNGWTAPVSTLRPSASPQYNPMTYNIAARSEALAAGE